MPFLDIVTEMNVDFGTRYVGERWDIVTKVTPPPGADFRDVDTLKLIIDTDYQTARTYVVANADLVKDNTDNSIEALFVVSDTSAFASGSYRVLVEMVWDEGSQVAVDGKMVVKNT